MAADLRTQIRIQQALIVVRSVNIDVTFHAVELRAYSGVLRLVKWGHAMALHAQAVTCLCEESIVWASVRAVTCGTPITARIM